MNVRSHQKRFPKGFTLVELLVVIAIISVLTAIVTVSASAARENAKIKSETAKVGQMELDMKLYREQHKALPPNDDNCSICTYADAGRDSSPGESAITSSEYENIASRWKLVTDAFEPFASVDVTEDAWGNPYGYDNNYLEENDDLYTTLCSAGPDGIMQTFTTADRVTGGPYDLRNPQPVAAGDDICVFFY